MGDRCYLSFTVRGHVNTVQQMTNIIEALQTQGMEAETYVNGPNGQYTRIDGLEEEFLNAILHNENPCFVDEECNYANIEGLEQVMQTMGIAYNVSHGSGSEYPAGVFSWCREFGRHEAVQGEGGGGTMLDLSAVKAVLDDPTALAQLIVDAEKAEGEGLPNFTVGEEVRQYFAPQIAKAALGIKAA